MTSQRNTVLACISGVIICLVISSLAGWITGHNINDWYVYLHKPTFNPPSWVFAPVWTVLYVMIGISGGFLWCHRKQFPLLFLLYLIQLFFNFLWSFVFFGMHQIGWAVVDIVLLWLSLLWALILAYSRVRGVFWLLLPYFLWVSFASFLNFCIWQLNR